MEKEKKELKEKQEREKKEQKEREKRENEMKKKFKVSNVILTEKGGMEGERISGGGGWGIFLGIQTCLDSFLPVEELN